MTPTRTVGSSRHALESCALQLHAWKPFQPQSPGHHLESSRAILTKKPCRSDRSTAPNLSDPLDFSRLSLLDDPPPPPLPQQQRHREEGIGWFARKRRRRRGGSRSVSGRSSDRSGTCRRCCSVGGGVRPGPMRRAPISPSPLGARTPAASCSSTEMGTGGRMGMDREASTAAPYQGGFGVLDLQWNESGYGSETGYRGDAEHGYGDEFDEEEDDGRVLFWGDHFGDYRESSFSEQKVHHRCRRKKHDPGLTEPMR
ncbi:unnamed protein product [Spirodela intermedia]|uniref:Uncharacterized protein n=1 Tax=Spirodela intermedia TaxID=51605 RepID=A0A7I8JH74_SPIIN|nr:unnamed protein product [Spirodela intermedia]CAA6669105.1 unnamed protein product [Spirodela intermedia]